MIYLKEISEVLDRLESLRDRGVGAAGEAVSHERLALLPWRDQVQTTEAATLLAVSLANHAGGQVILGVEPEGGITGVGDLDQGRMVRDVFALTRPGIVVELQELPRGEKTVWVMGVPAGSSIHATADGRRVRRVGSENLPITPDQDALLLFGKMDSDPGDQPVAGATLRDINPLQMAYLREILRRRHDQGEILGLADEEILATLGLLTERGEPRQAALLLLGNRDFLSHHLPQVEVVYIHYGPDEEPDQQEHLCLPILHTLSRLTDLIEAKNRFVTFRQGLFHHKVKDFDEEVYREALVNALVHRDYGRRDGAVYLHHYPDRMEISNPGGFVGGVATHNILYHAPRHRNRRLAEALQQLGLMERGGHGVNRLYRLLLRRGKEPPLYEDTPDSVVLTLQGGTMDERFAAFVAEEEQKGQVFTLDFLILLFHLKRHRTIDQATAATLCQRPTRAVGTSLSRMVDLGYLERVLGNRGQTSSYRLSPRLYSIFQQEMAYFRDRGLEGRRQKMLVVEVAIELGSLSLDNIQELCGTDLAGAKSLAETLVEEGRLQVNRDTSPPRYVPHPHRPAPD